MVQLQVDGAATRVQSERVGNYGKKRAPSYHASALLGGVCVCVGHCFYLKFVGVSL